MSCGSTPAYSEAPIFNGEIAWLSGQTEGNMILAIMTLKNRPKKLVEA